MGSRSRNVAVCKTGLTDSQQGDWELRTVIAKKDLAKNLNVFRQKDSKSFVISLPFVYVVFCSIISK